MTEEEEFEFRARAEAEQKARMSAPQAIASDATAATENTSGGYLNAAKRQLGLAGRAIANATASPLTLGGNIIGKGVNAIAGREIFQPSTDVFNAYLTKAGMPEAETGIEKFVQDVARTAPAFALPGGFGMQVAGNAAIGAADAPTGKELSGALWGSGGAGVGHALTSVFSRGLPGISREARQLMDTTNVQPTVGMAVPRLRAAEEFMTGIPFVGEIPKAARRRALNEFSTEAIQRATPDMPRPQGTPFEQLDTANDYVSGIYHDVLPQVRPEVRGTNFAGVGGPNALPPSAQSFAAGRNRALQNSFLTDAQREIIERVYRDRAPNISSYTGEQLKQLDSELGEYIRRYQGSSSTASLAESLREMQLGLREGIESRLPAEQQGRLADANRSYRELIALNDAASKNPELVVTPQRLSKAMAARDKRPISRLQGPMAEYARNAESVLPNSANGRAMMGQGVLGTALGVGGAAYLGALPQLLAAGALGTAGATRSGQAALTGNLAVQRALRRYLQSGQEIAPALGAAAVNQSEEQ